MMHVTACDHVGVRVTDPTRSIAFHTAPRLAVDKAISSEQVAGMVSEAGVRPALAFNGVPMPCSGNILPRCPRFTHSAFIVHAPGEVLAWAREDDVVNTEGSVDQGRRLTCFRLDPDGIVPGFNEPVDRAGQA